MPSKRILKYRRRTVNVLGWVSFALFLCFFTWLWFFLGTQQIYQLNRDRSKFDQQNNIQIAFKTIERETQPLTAGESVTEALWRPFPHYTDGVVNPLWPWVAARFAEDDHAQFFRKGKWFNLTMMLGVLLFIGVGTALAFSRLSAVVIILVGGLGSWLPRATYFQPEPLYYALFFLAWCCALLLMRRNSLWIYGMLGTLSGLAYLAKGSIQLMLVVFVGVTVLRSLAEWFTQRKTRGDSAVERDDPDPEWNLANQFIGLAVVAMMFLIVVGARFNYASEYYGSPTHSYPSYWMWMDDFDTEAIPFMVKYGNAEALANLPAEEKPSPGKYFREHTTEEAVDRLKNGVAEKFRTLFFPLEIKQNKAKTKPWKYILPQRGWVLIGLAALLLIIAIIAQSSKELREQLQKRRRRSAIWMFLFALGCFVAYSLAYGWFTPIGKGDRFMLSLYLPLVVTILWICGRRLRQLRSTSQGPIARLVFGVAHVVILIVVGLRISELIETPLFR